MGGRVGFKQKMSLHTAREKINRYLFFFKVSSEGNGGR